MFGPQGGWSSGRVKYKTLIKDFLSLIYMIKINFE